MVGSGVCWVFYVRLKGCAKKIGIAMDTYWGDFGAGRCHLLPCRAVWWQDTARSEGSNIRQTPRLKCFL
jgi:hypothetical protein